MTKIFSELTNKLIEAGVPQEASKQVNGVSLEINHPINVLINTDIDASQYSEILIDYAPKLSQPNEIEAVIRCMTQPSGFEDALPWLISLFQQYPDNGLSLGLLWVAGNAIAVINNKEYYQEVISICKKSEYGDSRQMLMGMLSKIRTDKAYQVLIENLSDQSVKGQVIEALGMFGRVDALPILKSTSVETGKYEHKALKKALHHLSKIQSSNQKAT